MPKKPVPPSKKKIMKIRLVKKTPRKKTVV
jgi:hypothetical protein